MLALADGGEPSDEAVDTGVLSFGPLEVEAGHVHRLAIGNREFAQVAAEIGSQREQTLAETLLRGVVGPGGVPECRTPRSISARSIDVAASVVAGAT